MAGACRPEQEVCRLEPMFNKNAGADVSAFGLRYNVAMRRCAASSPERPSWQWISKHLYRLVAACVAVETAQMPQTFMHLKVLQ